MSHILRSMRREGRAAPSCGLRGLWGYSAGVWMYFTQEPRFYPWQPVRLPTSGAGNACAVSSRGHAAVSQQPWGLDAPGFAARPTDAESRTAAPRVLRSLYSSERLSLGLAAPPAVGRRRFPASHAATRLPGSGRVSGAAPVATPCPQPVTQGPVRPAPIYPSPPTPHWGRRRSGPSRGGAAEGAGPLSEVMAPCLSCARPVFCPFSESRHRFSGLGL